MVTGTDCKFKLKETERWIDSPESKTETDDERVSLLYSAWGALLTESVRDEREFWQKFGLNRSSVPKAPHLENCQLSSQTNTRLDTRAENESFPPWTSWKGLLDMYPASAANEQLRYRHRIISEGAYPPWVCFQFTEFINYAFYGNIYDCYINVSVCVYILVPHFFDKAKSGLEHISCFQTNY